MLTGAILRRERHRAGLTPEALAQAAGIDRTYVSLLEHGEASLILETLLRFCRSIGVTAAEVERPMR